MLHVDIARRLHIREVTTHGHHPEMFDGELDLRMHRVQLPDTHEQPPVTASVLAGPPGARTSAPSPPKPLAFSYLLVLHEPPPRLSCTSPVVSAGHGPEEYPHGED